MVAITHFIMEWGWVLMLLFCFCPLILKYTVNMKIEKRYKCKLNVELENRKFFPLYSYFKSSYPAATIAMAYIFNSKKMIEKYPGLKEINYNIKTAPKMEIFICVIFWFLTAITALSLILFGIFTQIFNIKPF